jgi:MFS transporter, DHA3 family, macrolide efflux protein
MSEAPAVGLRTPLRRPDFRRLWLAQTISDLGDGLTNLALMLLALKLSGSPAAVAAILILLEVPQVTLGLAAGVFVDRWERRRVMLASDLLRALVVLGFVAVDSADLLWLLFVLAFAQASVGTFFSPARTALVASVLPAEELFAANSLGQLSRVLSTVLGASAAGLLVGLSGQYWPAFAFDAATFAVSVAMVSRVGARSRPVRTADSHGLTGELGEGLGLIGRSPVLVGTLLATATAMLGIRAVNVLWVPLFQADLHVPTTLFGAADLAQASAMILGAGIAVRLVASFGPTRIVTGSLAALGVAVALVAAVTSFWQVLLLLFAVGWVVSPLQAAVTTIVQTSTTDELRGRTAAALGSVMSTANIASMGLAGIVAGGIGVRGALALAGAVIGGSAMVAFLLFRRRSGEGAQLGGPKSFAPAAPHRRDPVPSADQRALTSGDQGR